MKFFFFLLGCFMLYLSCIPCGDSKECNNITSAKISVTDKHDQHNHEEETCTPFCTCSCCAATACYIPCSKALALKVFQTKQYPQYKIIFRTEAFYSIWQPPKLAA